jgi:UDP-N-acetylmuramoylalanine--D-glutamate ligase
MLSLAGKRLLVVGFGLKTGVSIVRFAINKGAWVRAVDAKTRAGLQEALDALESSVASGALCNFELIAGGMPLSGLDGIDLIVLSPGVARAGELCQAALQRGLPVIGDIELAWHFASCRIAGVTGTDGKSTTVSMVGSILACAGMGRVAGNIGIPVLNVIEEMPAGQILALELSSFMLESIDEFSPELGAILNLSEDHLDRYSDMETYLQAKLRLFECLRPGAAAVYPLDAPQSARFEAAVPPGVSHVCFAFANDSRDTRAAVYFRPGGSEGNAEGGAQENAKEREGWLMLHGSELMPVSELKILGRHNIRNALAAAAIACALGMSPEQIRTGLAACRGLSHRYENAGCAAGVRFINDSKATTVSSVLSAVESVSRGACLLLGGRDKGLDFLPLAEAISAKELVVFPFGEAREKIRAALVPLMGAEGEDRIAPGEAKLESAVRRAWENAKKRGAFEVLLAPGCTSYDEFANFEERGDCFKNWVAKLREEAEGV